MADNLAQVASAQTNAQRLQNVTEREEAPTRPAWMAFKEKQKEFDQAEKSLADSAADAGDDKEDPKVANFAEWKKLKEFQRQERTDFFGEGKSEFIALRRIINREVREEFRERWADYYAFAANNPDAALLASTKADLVAEQKDELEARWDAGCDRLREARDDQYKVLLEYQKETRHGLRSRQEAGLDNHVFFRHMDDGTFRDQWPTLSATVSASVIVDDMKREAGELTGERTADGAQRSEHAFSDRPGHSEFRLTSGVTRGLDCEIARNTDPLRAVFASNPDPSALCVSIPPFGRIWSGRGLGDDVRGRDRRYPARLFRAAPAD